MTEADYLRKQMMFVVQQNAISDDLLREARDRVADPRAEALIARTSQLLCTLLTPTDAFEGFRGTALFGNSPTDRKILRRIPGTLLAGAWSAPMLEVPAEVAAQIYRVVSESDERPI